MIDSIVKFVIGKLRVIGNTDGTLIGNVSDSLKTSITNTVTVATATPATFSAWSLDTAIGNNKSMMSIVNTTGSTVTVKIQTLRIINSQNTAVTGVIGDFRLFRCVSHSSGTLITPGVHDTTALLNTSVTVRTGATIGTESSTVLGRWKYSTDEWGVGTADVESMDHGTGVVSSVLSMPISTTGITLRANEGITLKQVTNSTAGSFDINIIFTQE